MWLVKLFLGIWLCGWAVGEFMVAQILQAMVLCSDDFGPAVGPGTGPEPKLPDPEPPRQEDLPFVVQLATEHAINKAFVVPFLLIWLTFWTCGGVSVWGVFLTQFGSRNFSATPFSVTWLVLLAAFWRNIPVLKESRSCKGTDGWMMAWVSLPLIVTLVSPVVRLVWRSTPAGRRMARRRRGRSPVSEVAPGSTWRRLTAGVDSLRRLAKGQSKATLCKVAEELEHMLGENATCAICFSALHAERCAVFTTKERLRVCGHYYHWQCVSHLARAADEQPLRVPAACPLCRRPFARYMTMPDVLHWPEAWFNVADCDGDGCLTEAELVEALVVTLPVERELVRQRLHWGQPSLWQRWTGQLQGSFPPKGTPPLGITFEQFMAGESEPFDEAGLFHWLLAAREALRKHPQIVRALSQGEGGAA